MRSPKATWKKIYIFLAVTIILALNLYVVVIAVRAQMPAYQKNPYYVEAVNTEVNRVLGIDENKLDDIKQALPEGLAEYAVTMIIPNVLLIGLAVSIYKTKSYKAAGEDGKVRKHRIVAIVFGCLTLILAAIVASYIGFVYMPRAQAEASSLNVH